MASDTSDVLTMLRDSATDFCARALAPARLRALREGGSFDHGVWQEMVALGWSAVLIDEDAGGLGLDIDAAGEICRHAGGVAAPEPLLETAVAAASIARHCAAGDGVARAIAGGAVVVAALPVALDEVFTEMTAVGDAAGYRLTGAFSHVALGQAADAWLVPATLDGAPAWFHVTRDAPGLALGERVLPDHTTCAEFALQETPAALLAADTEAEAACDAARIAIALCSSAYLLGAAEALYQLTTDYVGTRRQFGSAIGSFQVIQHRLVDLYLQLRLTEAVVKEALLPGMADMRAASRARHRSCHAAMLIAREAIQLHGAIGTTDECDVGLYVNRILAVVANYGTASLHRQRFAAAAPATTRHQDAPATQADPDLVPPNGDWNRVPNDTFRGVVRAWFEANYPAAMRNPRARLHWPECRDWYACLYDRGWAAPGWPVEHGGMGLNAEKLLIFIEERERHGVARTPDQGIIMVGPLLMQHGSEAQQAYYLPRALSGEHIWCQGYSEPNAGSDLASLATRADREGDEFVVNGQKIWTTMAQDATHIFCLVRTDREAKPQAGISFLLIDITSPGISVRPIRNIAGDEEFCEVFFDDVRVPVENLVGDLNDGWRVAKALLGFERIFIGSPKQCQHALARLRDFADGAGLWHDPVFVDGYTRFELDVADLESLYKAFADILKRGETLGPDVSVLKIWASDTLVRLTEFMLDWGGTSGVAAGSEDIDLLSQYYNARPTTIYGGSNEIQRNILAKQVLRLPSA